MTTKTIWAFFFAIVHLAQGNAQEANRQLSFSIGPSYIARQDIIFSPFIHQTFSAVNSSAGYQKDKKIHQYAGLSFTAFSPGLETPYEYIYDGEVKTAHPHSLTMVSLEYGQGKYLKENKRSIIGGEVNLDVQALNYQYGRSSFFGYFSTLGLHAWYKQVLIQHERNQLTARIEIPLVSWLSRSPYLINDDTYIENTYSHHGLKTFFAFMGDGHVATWGELHRADIHLDYARHFSEKISVGLGYHLGFLHAGKPADLFSYQHDLRLRVDIKI